MRRTITTALTALLICSCIYEDLSNCPNYNRCPGPGEDSTAVTKAVPVEFTVSTWADSTATRSSISASEDAVQDINLYAYHEGILESSIFLESPQSFTMTLYTGRTYHLYALANMGEVEAPDTEEEMLDYNYSVSDITDISGSLPMAWTDLLTVSGSAPKSGISLERLLSRIRFSIDRSQLDEFEITSARLCQGALGVHPFQSDSKAESTDEVGNGDYATTSDLQALNANQEITFYALENCQGTLLPGNADPTSKVPDEIPDHSDLCTYLEMTASYTGEYKGVTVSSDNVTYRFYLGEDNCSDFNVKRNRDVSINLTVTEDRIFDESWRVSYGENLPTVSYGLENSKSSASLKVGGTTYVSALYYKLVDGSRISENDITSYAAWSTSNSGVATVSEGKITAVSEGTATITATYNGYKATTTVTVSNTLSYSLVLNKTSLSVQEGSTESLIATYITYTNGEQTSSKDVTSSTTWSTSASSTASVSKGTVTGVAAGSATITASYSGYKTTCSVTVTEKPITYTYALKVTLSESSIDVGGTTAAKATYITYADGVESSTKDVTSSATWSSSDPSVATASGGTVTGESAGSATITATYNGYSDDVTVTVSDKITYELMMSPTSMSIQNGRTSKFTAVYRTLTNGTQTYGQDVSTSSDWTSSDTSVATVGSNGLITAVGLGNATITAKYNGFTVTGSVTVTPAYTYELVVSPSEISILVDETETLIATYITYADGVVESSEDVTSSASWSSSDNNIVSVSRGRITGEAIGSATLSASYKGYTASSKVMVSSTANLTLGWSEMSLEVGDNITNTVTYHPNDGTAAYVVTSSATWMTSNPAVATVSKGTITAEGEGTATITASYGGLTASCTVTVTAIDDPYPEKYVSTMSAQSVNITGTSNYRIKLSLKFSDGSVIEDVPYTWAVTFSQNSNIATGTSGDGPLIYTGGGGYTMAISLTTTAYYYDANGTYRKHTTGTSFSHNTSWEP